MSEHGAMEQRQLRDPRELRAFAHPLRLSLLEELATLGEATATELAERLDETPANCSWHLRQLAKHGFIEEGEPGPGRRRPWRWVPQVPRISPLEDESPTERRARAATVDMLRGRDMQAWQRWQAVKDEAPAAWLDASFDQSALNWLTADELKAFADELQDVVDRHLLDRLERVDVAKRPDGATLVRFATWGFPAGEPDELPLPTASTTPDRDDTGSDDMRADR